MKQVEFDKINKTINTMKPFLQASVNRIKTKRKKMSHRASIKKCVLRNANYRKYSIEKEFVRHAFQTFSQDLTEDNFDIKRRVLENDIEIEVSFYILNKERLKELVKKVALMALKDALIFEMELEK